MGSRIRKRFLRIGWFHSGRFLFEKRFEERFEEVAFCSKVALKRNVSTAERQLTYPEGGPKDNETYAEDGSGGTILIRRMVVESTVLIGRAVVERAVVERAVSIRGGRWCSQIANVPEVHTYTFKFTCARYNGKFYGNNRFP